MLNDQQDVIYVGKAKQLKNRLKSYFTGAHNEKTTRLVSEIRDFHYVLTNTEHESLILENNLIKKHTPKYNIRLMDDKTYPYIEITVEKHPRLQVVRTKHPKGRVFGPYPNVYGARETVRLLNALYPLRKCEKLPKKACLYYHIGQCLAPCIHPIEDYKPLIKELTLFLKGETKPVLDRLKEDMNRASENMRFEQAIEFRDMINHIESTTEKQIINTHDQMDRDIIGFAYNQEDVAIQILMIRNGKMMDQHQVVYAYVGEAHESVMSYLNQYYEQNTPKELIFSTRFQEDMVLEAYGKKAVFPKIGDKKKLADLADKNADYDLKHYFMLNRSKDEKKQHALSELGALIKKTVHTIEIFDNAQLFGTSPISAMVVYEQGQLNPKKYRKYHLKTSTNDDYQAVREVVYRRYQRLLMEEQPLPELVLIDGGLGQVRAAQEMITSLGLNLIVAGLKKNKKHRLEALILNETTHLLKPQSDLYKLLVMLSEEVHRFAIDFHRKTRNKTAIQSRLDAIPGIGEKRKKALLNHFETLDAILEATDETLMELGIPQNIIPILKEALK